MLKNTEDRMRLARRLNALDFVRLRHGDSAYATMILEELLFAPPIFTDVEAALANYDFASAIRKLHVISEYAYSIDDRNIAEHAAYFAENCYKDALEELNEDSLYAHFALYEGLLDCYCLIVND